MKTYFKLVISAFLCFALWLALLLGSTYLLYDSFSDILHEIDKVLMKEAERLNEEMEEWETEIKL